MQNNQHKAASAALCDSLLKKNIGCLKPGVFLSALASFFLLPLNAQAVCTEIAAGQTVPDTIKRGDCYELLGANQFSKITEVYGKLFIKTGSRVDFTGDKTIRVQKGGHLGVRGVMSLKDGASVLVTGYGQLENSNELLFEEHSVLHLERSASFENKGSLRFFPSSRFNLDRDSAFTTAGTFTLDNAGMEAASVTLKNLGTFSLVNGSIFNLSGNSSFMNKGLLTQEKNCTFSVNDTSRLTNMRNVELSGETVFDNTASIINRLIFSIGEQGRLTMKDGSTISNMHIVKLSGTLTLDDHSEYTNARNLQIYKNATMNIKSGAMLINDGTVYDRGKVNLEHSDGIKNRNIFYVNGEKVVFDLEEKLRN